MDDHRLGRALRALRIRRNWRQIDLARVADVSRAVVSRLERGEFDRSALTEVRRVGAALGVQLELMPRGVGAELDRLVDAGHAAVVDAVIRQATAAGWTTAPEVSFSVYGERGSIDVLCMHPATHQLLVVEAKTEITDLQAMLAAMDRKRRLAPRVARERGWQSAGVSAWLAVVQSGANRRRVAEHTATLRAALPHDGRHLRRWLRAPEEPIAALTFIATAPGRSITAVSVGRVRPRTSDPRAAVRHVPA